MKVAEPQTDEVMDYRGLAMYLKLAQTTLRRRVMLGRIPYFKIGRSVRFSKNKIDLWLEEQHQGAKQKKAKENIDSDGEEND